MHGHTHKPAHTYKQSVVLILDHACDLISGYSGGNNECVLFRGRLHLTLHQKGLMSHTLLPAVCLTTEAID